MLALSIRQPWLHFIVKHGKRRENRNKPIAHRGRIYLHASSGCSDAEHDAAVKFLRNRIGVTSDVPHWREMPRGALVATADLVDCVENEPGDPWAFTGADGEPMGGRYGLILENVEALPEPIPCPGRPWLFEVPDAHVPARGPLRVVIGSGADGCAAYRAARARGGTVVAVAPEGDALAEMAGALSGLGAASCIVYADEVIEV